VVLPRVVPISLASAVPPARHPWHSRGEGAEDQQEEIKGNTEQAEYSQEKRRRLKAKLGALLLCQHDRSNSKVKFETCIEKEEEASPGVRCLLSASLAAHAVLTADTLAPARLSYRYPTIRRSI